MHPATSKEHAEQAALAGFVTFGAAFVFGLPTTLILTLGWQVTGLFYFACFTAIWVLVALEEMAAR